MIGKIQYLKRLKNQVKVEFEQSNGSGMFFSRWGQPVSIETDRVLDISPSYYISSRLSEYFETLRGAACEIELLFSPFIPLPLLLPMSPVKLPLSPARPTGSFLVSLHFAYSLSLPDERSREIERVPDRKQGPGNGLLWSSSKAFHSTVIRWTSEG